MKSIDNIAAVLPMVEGVGSSPAPSYDSIARSSSAAPTNCYIGSSPAHTAQSPAQAVRSSPQVVQASPESNRSSPQVVQSSPEYLSSSSQVIQIFLES